MGRVRRLIARWSCSTSVVEIFGLADLDRRFTISIDRFERGEIGAAFVDGHRLGRATLGDRLFKVTPGCRLVTMGAQQEVDGVTVLVNGAVESPLTRMYVS